MVAVCWKASYQKGRKVLSEVAQDRKELKFFVSSCLMGKDDDKQEVEKEKEILQWIWKL